MENIQFKPHHSVEHHYQHYLSKMGLTEERMHEQQRIQLREAYYAAFSGALVLFRDDILQTLPEIQPLIFEKMFRECVAFWNKTKNKLG